MCAKHLLYLGRGLFIEFTTRPPLEVTPTQYTPAALSKTEISEIEEIAGTATDKVVDN